MERPRSSNAVALVLVSLFAAACTSGKAPPPSLTQGDAPRGCPLGVPGARVVADYTNDGIALSFTSKDKPEEMRERAIYAAAQRVPGSHAGLGHEGRHGLGGDHGLQLIRAPATRSVAENIEDGSRIVFVPIDRADRARLRANLVERANAMNGSPCK